MSNAYGINGSSPVSYTTGFDAGVTSMSADSLLAYCQMQLGDLDGQINGQMTQQKQALQEREAVQSVQNVLNGFGTIGPKNMDDMQTCVDAFNNAIAQLPAGDPVATQLSDSREKMTTDYGYQAPQILSDAETTQLSDAQTAASAPTMPTLTRNPTTLTTYVDTRDQDAARAAAQKTVADLTAKQNGTFTTKPNADQKEWQTKTTDPLAALADDIKSNAEIQMLQLQDLVSQRQQAIQLCSGMMSKTDQTLEDQAKAIGH